jgi:hypothetical protein
LRQKRRQSNVTARLDGTLTTRRHVFRTLVVFINRISSPMRMSLIAILGIAAVMPQPAFAAERDVAFFKSVAGEWTGPGEVVAGKYKGTKFVCNFKGIPAESPAGMVLDGGCRVGLFTQKMTASIQKSGSGYVGKFNDGAEGKGLDVVSGNVVNSRKVVFGLNRKSLNGSMQARLPDDNSMIVTVSVRVAEQMVPVIGMNLKRVESVASAGSVKQD